VAVICVLCPLRTRISRSICNVTHNQYGRTALEWNKLADWVCDHELFSSQNRWIVQIPRLYHIYKRMGIIKNFEEMLTNIFEPLFAVTLDPSSNPKLHRLLKALVGFDAVDDESKREDPIRDMPLPRYVESTLSRFCQSLLALPCLSNTHSSFPSLLLSSSLSATGQAKRTRRTASGRTTSRRTFTC
jgi:hypothetical protein